MTYIGKKYKIGDRSYSINLSKANKDNIHKNSVCLVLCEPYRQEVTVHLEPYTHDFINVLYKGDTIRVLFNKRNVIKEPKGITAETFIDIGKMFEEFCGGSKKEEPSEVDKLRSEITFLREELNKQREELNKQKQQKDDELIWTYKEAEKFKDISFLNGKTVKFVDVDKDIQEPIKSRGEIERKLSAIQERNKYTTNLRSNWELRARMEALNWVLGKQ